MATLAFHNMTNASAGAHLHDQTTDSGHTWTDQDPVGVGTPSYFVGVASSGYRTYDQTVQQGWCGAKSSLATYDVYHHVRSKLTRSDSNSNCVEFDVFLNWASTSNHWYAAFRASGGGQVTVVELTSGSAYFRASTNYSSHFVNGDLVDLRFKAVGDTVEAAIKHQSDSSWTTTPYTVSNRPNKTQTGIVIAQYLGTISGFGSNSEYIYNWGITDDGVVPTSWDTVKPWYAYAQM